MKVAALLLPLMLLVMIGMAGANGSIPPVGKQITFGLGAAQTNCYDTLSTLRHSEAAFENGRDIDENEQIVERHLLILMPGIRANVLGYGPRSRYGGRSFTAVHLRITRSADYSSTWTYYDSRTCWIDFPAGAISNFWH